MTNYLKDALVEQANSADGIKTGDTSDYILFDKVKGKRYIGNTTVWKDMIMDIFGRRLTGIAGTVDYDFGENAMVFQPNGNINNANHRIGGNQEINHEFKIGASITFKPHLHWWQQVTSGVVKPVVFTLRYRHQKNGVGKTTSWTTITADAGSGGDDAFDFTSEADGLYNQITHFNDITISCGVSDEIQIQMTRSDSETGDVSVKFFDIHGEVDSDGSEEEIYKS